MIKFIYNPTEFGQTDLQIKEEKHESDSDWINHFDLKIIKKMSSSHPDSLVKYGTAILVATSITGKKT